MYLKGYLIKSKAKNLAELKALGHSPPSSAAEPRIGPAAVSTNATAGRCRFDIGTFEY
jgi:hypothetical protein